MFKIKNELINVKIIFINIIFNVDINGKFLKI